MSGARRTRFVSTFSDEGSWIQLLDAEADISPRQWVDVATSSELLEASHLLALAGDGRAEESADGIFLPNATLATLGDAQVRALNLPPPAPFVLEIRSKGVLADAAFRFETRWYRTDGRSIAVAGLRGVELNALGSRYIVLDPMYTILQRIRAFNEQPPADLDKKMEVWGELRSLMGGDASAAAEIRPDRYLDNMRVYRATRFTLELEAKPDGSIDFEPVLLDEPATLRPSDEDTPESSVDDFTSLLPPAQNPVFARRFREHESVRKQYAVEGGAYVVFSDEARKALTVVRSAQRGSPTERKEFARNPRAFMRELLEQQQAEGAAIEMDRGETIESFESIFVETQQFSDRVREIGLWERPTLPWLTARTEGWLPPEEVPVSIDGRDYSIHIDDLPNLVEDVGSAIVAGSTSVPYREQDIPATEEAQSALCSAHDKVSAAAEAWLGEQDQKEALEQPAGPYSFKGGENDNFEIDAYTAKEKPRDHNGFDLPLLANTLIPHQEAGVAWLQARWEAGFRGALLADDMGLGKTFQCLAFLAWLKRQMRDGKQPNRPILVVAPTGLIPTWRKEHQLHLRAPGIGKSFTALGANLAMYRHEGRQKDIKGGTPALQVDELLNFDWILTTYETLRDYQYSFGLMKFAAAIFDEAQKIKNPGALVTNVAKHMNVEFFVASTGTPVENRLADLWSITDAIQPGYLGPLRAFSAKYEDEKVPIDERSRLLAELRSKIEAVVGKTPPGMMTRRLKDATLRGLPEKVEHVVTRRMPPDQAASYIRAIEERRGQGRAPKDVLHAIQALRNISLHHVRPGEMEDDAYIAESARMSALFETLDQVRHDGDKALIFLESLEMQKYLAALIKRRYALADLPMIISGEVSGSKRQERVDRFQSDPNFDAMILSPKAGGVGLTLTRANHVIHLSRWWNPAVEDQCTDRVYRIGQDKPVHVYYLQAVHPTISEHSFDVKLHALLDRKRALSRQLLLPSSFADGDASELYNETVGSVDFEPA